MAASNAEFFNPYGNSTMGDSRPTKVSGRPAHTVVLKFKDDEGGTGHLRLTLIAVDGTRSAFLIGLAVRVGDAGRKRVDAVLESASIN